MLAILDVVSFMGLLSSLSHLGKYLYVSSIWVCCKKIICSVDNMAQPGLPPPTPLRNILKETTRAPSDIDDW